MPGQEELDRMNPGHNLTPETEEGRRKIAERLQTLCGKLRSHGTIEEAGDPDRGCDETLSPLAVRVNRLIRQRDGLCAICGEMLATFTIPQNKPQIDLLGPVFASAVAGWQKEFRRHSGDPGS